MILHTAITLHGRSSNAPLGTQPHAPSWEHFAHQADIGVRGYGHCPEEAFNQTALALIAVITDPRCIEPHETLTLECRAPDLELLLVDWLNALIFEIATRHMLFCAFDVSIKGHHLHATAWGETIDPARHQPAVEVKGATLTELHVEAIEEDLWMAQCVVDV
ncbi:MAG TPA: archease [Gammaproteobacteria bacterium]|jgi:SHS2 domain-containing protein|nr:archease [Gammaproteobacteria bacterium]